MVYVVERYLPGLTRADLLPGLSRLEPVIEELRGEGSLVRYLGSTIVLEDEACFCEFEDPRRPRSPRPTAERACRSTGSSRPCSFNPYHRSDEMSISTSIPQTTRRRRFHPWHRHGDRRGDRLTAWAIATYAVESGSGRRRAARADPRVRAGQAHATGAAVCAGRRRAEPRPRCEPLASAADHPAGRRSRLRSLTPREHRLRAGDRVADPSELAAFGTAQVSDTGAGPAQRS